ncbi:MAG: ATP-binding cassette domain-containing protein [Anaeroplasma sp.]
MITLNNISIKYDKEPVINNFTYQFNDTGIYAIKGESGSGKTTLLNAIAGIVDIYEGEILYSKEIANLAKSISLIFQENNLFDELSVYDNIKVLTAVSKINPSDEEIDVILDKMKIKKYKKTLVANLSGGERQRVSIAIALLLDKKVIIADEPFSSLDEVNSKIIADIFKELAKERLIIFSSHNTTIINEYCDNIIDLMNYGCKNINNNENLLPANDEKNNLDFKTFRFINKKLMNGNKSQKFFLLVILLLLATTIAFSISITNYSKAIVINKTIDEEKIKSILVYDIVEEKLNTNLNNYRIISEEISKNSIIINSDENNMYFSPFQNVFKNIIIDNSLDDNEAIISDYSAYMLKHYKSLYFNDITSAPGNIFAVINPFNNETIMLKINKIIRTDFSNYYKTNQNLPMDIYSQIEQCYMNLIVNEQTYHKIKENNEIASEVIINDISTNIYIEESLSDNNIIISQGLLSYLNSLYSKEYTINDTILIEFINGYISMQEVKISKIENNDNHFIYTSNDFYSNINYELSEAKNRTDGYFITGYSSSKEIELVIKEAIDNKLTLNFFGSYNIETLFDSIDIFEVMFLGSTIILLAIAILFIIHFVFASYALNIIIFSILELYGIKRIYELYLIFYNNFKIIIFSLLLSLLSTYGLNLALDNFLVESLDIILYIPTFNHLSSLYSIIILFITLLISFILGYLISLKRKIKSHIIK